MRADRPLSALSSDPGGGGEDDPSGVVLCHARGAPVRCEDAARNCLSVARDGQWTMPDARREAARGAARNRYAWKHGYYSAEVKRKRREVHALIREMRSLMRELGA